MLFGYGVIYGCNLAARFMARRLLEAGGHYEHVVLVTALSFLTIVFAGYAVENEYNVMYGHDLDKRRPKASGDESRRHRQIAKELAAASGEDRSGTRSAPKRFAVP
jgi:hypothetical protein